MIILVPVSQYRITYELGAGRPYSHFERMLLSAIREGACVLSDLQAIFHVHPRLLIEGLVTLTQAGWLAVGDNSSKGFVLTAEGKQAASSSAPPSTTIISSRTVTLLLERVTGGLISKDEVRFVTKRDLSAIWSECGRVKSDVFYNDLDEGQVQHLLPRKKGTWVRWIGPIDMVSRESNWIPVNVDLEARTILGLPDTLANRLRPAILETAEHMAGKLTADAMAHSWDLVSASRQARVAPLGGSAQHEPDLLAGFRTSVPARSLVFSADAHQRVLAETIGGSTKSLVIASGLASCECLDFHWSALESALARGVSVDILWGEQSAPEHGRSVTELFKRLAFEAKKKSLPGALRFNSAPCSSRANIVIADDGGGGHLALIGSCPWLGTPTSQLDVAGPRSYASLRIDAPRLIAVLARCLAGIWRGIESELLSSTGDRWRRIATELEIASIDSADEGEVRIRVVLDHEHNHLTEGISSPSSGVLIAGETMSPIASREQLSAIASLDSTVPVSVFFDRSVVEWDGSASPDGVSLSRRPGLHANVLVVGSTSCISSYDFLASKSSNLDRGLRHVGLAVEGGEVASAICRELGLS